MLARAPDQQRAAVPVHVVQGEARCLDGPQPHDLLLSTINAYLQAIGGTAC